MVCIDCPLALHIKDLVHPFKSIFVIHIHLLLLSLLSISLANCPCILFPFHSYFLCYFSVFLNSLRSTVSTFVIVLLVLTSTSNGSILFSTYQPRPFSSLFTLFSHPISPLQSFFQETYIRAASFFGCNSLFIVINFLVFLSISCSSCLFYLGIWAPYLTMETAQVFSVIILLRLLRLLILLFFISAIVDVCFLSLR